MTPWRWCRNTTRGPRAQTGDPNGMPFQISISPSRGPCRPVSSAATARGKHRVAARPGGWPGSRCARTSVGSPTAADVRIVTSTPAVGPERGDPIDVDLGAAGLGIVQIAPGQDVHAPQTGGIGEVGDDVDRIDR